MSPADAVGRLHRCQTIANALVHASPRETRSSAPGPPPSDPNPVYAFEIDPTLTADRILRTEDFASVRADTERFLPARGVVSGAEYLVSTEVLVPPSPLSSSCLEMHTWGTACGPPGPDLIHEAVAQILAHDTALRWAARPTPRLVNRPGLLHRALPARLLNLMADQGVGVLVRVNQDLGVDVAIVLVHDADHGRCTAGVCAADNLVDGIREAFLAAVLRRQVVLDVINGRLPTPASEVVGLLDTWFRGREWFELIMDQTCAQELPPAWTTRHVATCDWVDLALRRFGHEPVVLERATPHGRRVVRVVCPGALIYRPRRRLGPLL